MEHIRINNVIAGAFLVMGLASYGTPLHAEEAEKPADGPSLVLGGNAYYSKYNFDRDRDESDGEEREGYYILSMPVSLSWKHYLDEKTFLAPYLNFTMTHDFGGESWNRHYWNNNQIVGLGVKVSREHSYADEKGEYTGGLYTALFSEYQFMTSSVDQAKNEVPEGISTENFKTGVSLWYARKKPIAEGIRLWTEVWGELAYHSTYFSEEGANNYIIGTIAPKAGLSFDVGDVAIEPYVKAELVNDFLEEEWNREPWINYLQYGPGVRIALDKFLPGSFSVYAEYLHVDYLDKKQDVSNDIRFGVNFWIPIL
ncbi:MAG: hypothetical protein K9G39_09935 [Chlorobium sp.]|uniref:hypothetical protein n=1 Tax=Chlorobium sp. TaxID=1095 RepID=UPI0025C4C268|nr:hypothetical protein [Chlorobium sp.]MCF8383888.1 hypothetical protein [Chlorobium sp.]